MRTTITMPVDLLKFLDRQREQTCHTRSAYIAMLIKRQREGVTRDHNYKRQPATKSAK